MNRVSDPSASPDSRSSMTSMPWYRSEIVSSKPVTRSTLPRDAKAALSASRGVMRSAR